jgi:ubiquitin C-terminal hydrolase
MCFLLYAPRLCRILTDKSPWLLVAIILQTAALEAEILSGSNQYACDYCGHKADATRQMALRSVPPYLCLPLQRFVYDYKKNDKVKASDRWG